MVATPQKPIGRMSARRGTGQPRNIKLWDMDAEPNSTAEALLRVYTNALAGVDKFEARKSELATNPELTPIGVQRAATDFAFREIIPAYQKGKLAVLQARQEVASRRSKLTPPTVDKADAAGAIRRGEVRALLRSLDDKARDAFLKKSGKYTGLDPEIRAAITEMPSSMSGVSDSYRDGLLRETMHAVHGAELDKISELERQIEIVESAIGATSEEIRKEAIEADSANADPDVYAARSKQAAGVADALWLKEFDEGGVKVIRAARWDDHGQTGSWVKASDEDISNGIMATSRQEYDRLKAATPVFGSGDEGRKARAAYVDEHGHEAYFARHQIGEESPT